MSEPPEPRLPPGYGTTENRWRSSAGDAPYREAAEPEQDADYADEDDQDDGQADLAMSDLDSVDLDSAGLDVQPLTGLPQQRARPQLTGRQGGRATREAAEPQSAEPQGQPGVSAASYSGSVKIGLWGSPQSGKTTFLAALRHATGTGDTGCGSWNIFPLNPASRELLVKFTHELVHERKFPEATIRSAKIPLQWLFVGDITGSRFARRRLLRRGPVESRFVLDLIDVTGGAFAYNTEAERVSADVASAALNHLTESQGLIYLFDPIGEKDNRDSSTYVNRTITSLQEHAAKGGGAGRYLPHHVSVCITKFDEPQIFQQARRMGLVNDGPDGMPRVLDEHAEEFFDALCTGRFWSRSGGQGDGSAQFIRQQLRANFDPKNIHYYVTSSIGFRKIPDLDSGSERFDPDDFANTHEQNGLPRIRGGIHPINVLEPLVNLQQRLTGRA